MQLWFYALFWFSSLPELSLEIWHGVLPVKDRYFYFVLPMFSNMLLLGIAGESNVVAAARICPFFLIAVRSSTVVFALAWVEWLMTELFNFGNTWHFLSGVYQPFGITLLGRLKYCLIPLQIFSVFLVKEIQHWGSPESHLSSKQMAFRGRHHQDTARNVCEEQCPC